MFIKENTYIPMSLAQASHTPLNRLPAVKTTHPGISAHTYKNKDDSVDVAAGVNYGVVPSLSESN